MPADAAAAVTDRHLESLTFAAGEQPYQEWREKICASFSLAKQPAHTTMAEIPA
jgi:hypothetical protein